MNSFLKRYMREEIDYLFTRAAEHSVVEEWKGELWGFIRGAYLADAITDKEFTFLRIATESLR